MIFDARQDEPHSWVVGITGVEVASQPCVFDQRGRQTGERGVVDRLGQDVAQRIEQFDDGVQRGICAIDVDPDLTAGIGVETVDVRVAGVVSRDKAIHFEAEPAIFVTVFFIGCQFSQELCVGRNRILLRVAQVCQQRPFQLVEDFDISIVTELL